MWWRTDLGRATRVGGRRQGGSRGCRCCVVRSMCMVTRWGGSVSFVRSVQRHIVRVYQDRSGPSTRCWMMHVPEAQAREAGGGVGRDGGDEAGLGVGGGERLCICSLYGGVDVEQGR